MKKIFILIVLFFSTIWGIETQAQSCCVKPISWKALAMSTDFKEAHLAPLPLNYTPEKGSMIQFETTDGTKGNAFFVPSDEPTTKVLVIFHEWWGLNDYIKREAVRWQKLLGNVDVYAVDLYDGKVADDPDVASKLASELDPKRGETIVKGVISKIGKDKLIGTIGWCMGGAWSFTAAVQSTNQAAGCVMYYGTPEQDAKKIKMLQTDILYIWGNQDKFIRKYNIDQLAEQVRANGHTFEFHDYDAVHGFANPSNPKYQPLYATQAQDIAVKFLKNKMALE